ncbi:MAG: putative periplasmic solute-binding protein [Frankiales bacterium]|nr:putative periplasmic solute-binding protein [Frankiales bacterium]
MSTPNKRLPKPVGLAVVAIVVLALVAGLGLGAKKAYDAVLGAPDYSGLGSGSVVVQVHSGDSSKTVGQSLLDVDVVKSVKAFTKAAKANSSYRRLQPGYYQLNQRMAAKNAVDWLLDGKHRKRGRVTIPEGTPLTGVIDRLVKGTELKKADIEAALANPAVLGLPSYAGGKAEGFLFPATYDIDPGSQAVDALQQMTQKFSEIAGGLDLTGTATKVHITPYEAVIVASLIEKETAQPAERAKVARVVYNRLKQGMRLQFDSPLQYVLPQRKGRLSLDDLKLDSPYNTYKVKGLPPTPIDSPGEAALDAALHPATGNWLYFVTIDKQGHSLFTNDYQAFLTAKAKAQREGVY